MGEPYPTNQHYQQQVFSFISAVLGQKNIIPVPVEFVRFTGDYNTAALLTQIIYWTDRTKDPDRWFYKSYAEWDEEIALSKYQVNRAAGVLKGMNLIETQVKKIFNGETVLHYRLDTTIFIDKFGQYLQSRKMLQKSTSEETSLPEVKKLDSLKSINFTPTPLLYTETNYLKTTTASKPSKPEKPTPSKPVSETKEKPSPSFEIEIKELMDLVPKHNLTEELTPQFKALFLKALIAGHTVAYIALAITYTKDKSKGSPQEFKAYLGKSLDNNYHAGYVSKKDELQQKQEKQRQLEADRRERERLKALKERQELEQIRLKDESRAKALEELKSINPTHYREIQLQALSELKSNTPSIKFDIDGNFVKSRMCVILGL